MFRKSSETVRSPRPGTKSKVFIVTFVLKVGPQSFTARSDFHSEVLRDYRP